MANSMSIVERYPEVCGIIDSIATDCNCWGVFCVRVRDYLTALVNEGEVSYWDYSDLEDYGWKYRMTWGGGIYPQPC